MLYGKTSSRDLRLRMFLLVLTLSFMGAVLPACNKSDSSAPSAQPNATGASTAAAPAGPRPTDAKTALEALVQGNERYASGHFAARDLSPAKLTELSKGQKPFAIVLTCSDSRVAPELLFDQSIGDIFVIRVAGNVMDKAGLGSIEYAAEHLNSPLVFVLGHEKCGAVTAATTGDAAEGNVQFLINEIKPAVQTAKGLGGDLVEKSVDENVRYVVNNMTARSMVLDHLAKEKKIQLAGGVYSLSTGKVKMVSDLGSYLTDQPEGEHEEKPAHQQKKAS